MAKAQGPGIIDRHIEKIILAACLVVLICAVARFGVSTPRRIVLPFTDQSGVTPKEVDAAILDRAESLKKQTEAVQPEPILPRNDLAILKQQQDEPVGVLGPTLAFGVPSPSGLRMSTAIGLEKTPPLDEMVKVMPAPKRPVSWAGEELIFVERIVDEQKVESLNETPVWRAVTWYPWGKLTEAWERKLENTVVIPEVIALGCEVEIQERDPNGDWKPAETVKPVLLPVTDNSGEVIKPEPIPPYDGANGEEVLQALRSFYENWMSYQLQPDFYDIWTKDEGQTSWMSHFPFEILDIFPAEEEGSKTTESRKPKKAQPVRRLPTGRAAAARARGGRTLPPGMDPMMLPPDMMLPPGVRGAVGPAARPDGRRIVLPKRKTAKRIKARKEPLKAPAEGKEPLGEIPDIEKQIEVGKTLAWFHTESIQFGREYRCRFRLVFANPLLTYSRNVDPKRPQDAETLAVKTEWSPWSKPISVSREVEFFVTGANPLRRQLTVTIFTKHLGQRIMHKIGGVVAGQNIRSKARTKVIDPTTNELKTDENGRDPLVDFDTGAIAVKFDFNKRITIPSGRVKNDAVEMIYLDQSGELHSRIMYFDRNSEKYKELLEEVNEAKKMIEPAKPVKRPEERKKKRREDRLPPPGRVPGDRMMPPDLRPPGAPMPRTGSKTRKIKR